VIRNYLRGLDIFKLHFKVVNARRNMSWEDYLKQVYYDPVNAGSFSGPDMSETKENAS
jgi:hypothetical protein